MPAVVPGFQLGRWVTGVTFVPRRLVRDAAFEKGEDGALNFTAVELFQAERIQTASLGRTSGCRGVQS